MWNGAGSNSACLVDAIAVVVRIVTRIGTGSAVNIAVIQFYASCL